MTQLYVQFSDASKTTIVACFSGPQDEVYYPFQGVVDSSDARYAEFYDNLACVSEVVPKPTPAT